MSEILKPCPFCGGKWEIKRWDSMQWYGRCTCCNKYTTPYSDYQAAENTVNCRPDPRQLTLDELGQMDGQPVEIRYTQSIFLSDDHIEASMYKFDFDDYGKTWTAYDRPPGGEAK